MAGNIKEIALVDSAGAYIGNGNAQTAVAVTPSDSTVVAFNGLWVGGAGAVAVTMKGGGNATFSGVAAGTRLPVSVTKVLATGTTATLILGLT